MAATAFKVAKVAAGAYLAWKAYSGLTELMDAEHSELKSGKPRAPPHDLYRDHFFQNAQGLWIYKKAWLPEGDTVGVVFIVHGVGEHCLRYEGVAESLNRRGLAVFSMDHQGHGQSEGDRVHVKDFMDYVNDVLQLVDETLEERPALRSLPRFLLGHSMGGAVTFRTAQTRPDFWTGIVFSGPALKVDPKAISPVKVALARYLANWLPKMRLESLDCEDVCSDPVVVQHYRWDPMVNSGGLRVRWGYCMLQAMDKIQKGLEDFSLPFLVVHGESDKLCAVEASREFMEKSKSADKQLITYPDLFHEIFNESNRDRVIKDVADWLCARCRL